MLLMCQMWWWWRWWLWCCLGLWWWGLLKLPFLTNSWNIMRKMTAHQRHPRWSFSSSASTSSQQSLLNITSSSSSWISINHNVDRAWIQIANLNQMKLKMKKKNKKTPNSFSAQTVLINDFTYFDFILMYCNRRDHHHHITTTTITLDT